MDERICRFGRIALALSVGASSVACGGSNGDSQVSGAGSSSTGQAGSVNIHVPDGSGGNNSGTGGAGSVSPGTLPAGFTAATMLAGYKIAHPIVGSCPGATPACPH